MNFKKWVKSIQTAGYNGASTVYVWFPNSKWCQLIQLKKHNLKWFVPVEVEQQSNYPQLKDRE